MPGDYVIDGVWLGKWLRTQREKYRAGLLPQEQINELNEIGMDWLSAPARAWETHFEACRAYYEAHGNLDLPLSYVDEQGLRLGHWLNRIRSGKAKLRTDGENGNQIARLESIGLRVEPDK